MIEHGSPQLCPCTAGSPQQAKAQQLMRWHPWAMRHVKYHCPCKSGVTLYTGRSRALPAWLTQVRLNSAFISALANELSRMVWR